MTETNNEVWRELIGAVMTVLERRRNRNAYFAMPIAYDADDAYRDVLRLLRTNALAIRLKRLLPLLPVASVVSQRPIRT